MEPGSTPTPLVQKKTWRDSLPLDILLSAVSVLAVAQSSSEIPEGLLNNPVCQNIRHFYQPHRNAIIITMWLVTVTDTMTWNKVKSCCSVETYSRHSKADNVVVCLAEQITMSCTAQLALHNRPIQRGTVIDSADAGRVQTYKRKRKKHIPL